MHFKAYLEKVAKAIKEASQIQYIRIYHTDNTAENACLSGTSLQVYVLEYLLQKNCMFFKIKNQVLKQNI